MEKKISLFDEMIMPLSKEYKDKMAFIDSYIKSMKALKFKRTIDKKSHKITYVSSDYGFSYNFKFEDNSFIHNMQWYLVHQGKPETWHRRADYMEETLQLINKTNIRLAAKMFDSLKECQGGDSCYGPRCLARTVYEFNGYKKLVCHGSIFLKMNEEEINDALEFIRYFDLLIEEKNKNNEPLPKKIILWKTKRSL